jgi:hypothetical protein
MSAHKAVSFLLKFFFLFAALPAPTFAQKISDLDRERASKCWRR